MKFNDIQQTTGPGKLEHNNQERQKEKGGGRGGKGREGKEERKKGSYLDKPHSNNRKPKTKKNPERS